jgi:pimeloyl-ACP methyl ester carboxylesterase
MPAPYAHRFVRVDGVRTHYLEAGEGPAVVLLHGGEYGGCAELSWRSSIAALAERFHVYAPDMVGFGDTEKLHHFEGASEFRVRHIAEFCRVLCIDTAHFVGTSYGGSLLLKVVRSSPVAWPVDRMILVSGGGEIPVNEHREVLVSYDGSFEHMRRVLQVLFWHERWWSDERVAEWHRSSLKPGAWEAASAARLAPPGRERPWRGETSSGVCDRPTMIVAGEQDLLRVPGYAPKLAAEIPGAVAHVFADARHYPHLEHPERFNDLAVDFLLGGADAATAGAGAAAGAAS